MSPAPPRPPADVGVVVRRPHSAVSVLTASGPTVDGESLLDAANRVLGEATGRRDADVWALDLSGPRAWFVADVPDVSTEQEARPPGTLVSTSSTTRDGLGETPVRAAEAVPPVTVAFRPLTRADLPDVVAWQARPHVARWWGDEAKDVDAAETHYGPSLDGTDPTRLWVLELNGRSVGLLQDYRIGDHPEYALLTAQPDAVGLDYLIGDPTWIGRGIGTRMLWTFLRDVVRPHYPDARVFFAAPDHRNAGSLRVLDKLGFTRGLWFDEPQPDGDTVVGCTLDVGRVLGRP